MALVREGSKELEINILFRTMYVDLEPERKLALCFERDPYAAPRCIPDSFVDIAGIHADEGTVSGLMMQKN